MSDTARENTWMPIQSAPRNATSVQVKMSDGIIHKDAHWASDLSGEEQPPFEGWFVPVKDQSGRILYYMEIREPVSWKPKEEICEDATKEHRRKKRKARVS